MKTTADLDRITADRAALEMAMAKCRLESPERSDQLDHMLGGIEPRPWLEVAEFAAYCCQRRALGLKAWELPPCHGDNPGDRPDQVKSRRLLQRMLAAGISRWHPDPMAALDARRAAADGA